jgi:transcriptional regulator
VTNQLAVVKGTLELLVLSTLANAKSMHGFAILDWIRESTGDALLVEEGALYPALHRMEQRGWLAADWAISEKGRRAKYYRLTKTGKQALASEEAKWTRYVEAMDQVAGRDGR